MDDKNAQELNALEEAAFNDPVKFLNEQHAPRTWTMSTEDLARTAAVSPYEIMATSEERWGPEKASIATTAVREFVRGFAGMADSTVNGIMEDRAKEIIYRSPNMRQQDANRLIEDVMRSGSLARQIENYESSKTAHDNFTAGISNGLGSMVSLALLGWATRSPAVVGAAAGIGEAYNAREEMVDRYIQEMGTAEGLADQLGKYNALSTGYGVFAGFVEGSIGVERLAAGALNRYGRLAAMERLARQQGRFGRALAYKTGRQVITTGLEEGGEEFVQSVGQDVAVALTRDMWENPDIKKALIQAGYGAIIGSTSGGVMYNIGRKRAIDFIRRWNDENNAGLTESQIVQAADAALDDVAQPMVDEIATRAELRNQYGQAYEILKNRFRQQIESTGTTPWTDQNKSMEEYIDTLASTLSIPAVLQANGLNIPTAQFLEIADMVVQDNVLQFVPLNNAAELEDIIARQTNVLAQQREAKKLGMGDDTARQTAERRKAIAQKALRNLREEERIRKQIVQEKRKADKKRLGYDEIDQAKKDTKFLKNARTLDSFKAKLEDGTTTEQAKNRLEAAFMNWIADKDKTLAEDLILYRGGMQKAVDLLTANAKVIYDTAKKHPGAGLREDIANALRKLRHTNKDNFLLVTQALARDGHDVMPENILLWHWVFADPTTNNQFFTNYTTKLAENREQVADGQALFGQKVAPLSKKDLIMQALQDTDQAKAQLAESRGRKYEPLFDKNGAVKEPYLAAAIVSYQNQFAPRFAQQMPRLFQEQFDLADENARLDEIYPEYSGKTIVVDGKKRTVYNSEGKRINKSAEALRNFWRWFGDSKAVDKKGRPLVVYHGARGNGNITIFDPQKGQNVEAVYFSKDINVAGHWSVKHAPKTFESAEKIKERISKITDVDELLTIHNRYDYDTLKVVEDKRNKGTFWLEGIYSIELLGEKAGDNIYVNKFGQKTDLAELLRKKIEQAIPDAIESDLYSVYMKLENPLIIDAGGKPYWQIDFRGEKVNTESIARFAKENGFDGLIVNNVLETDYENKLTDDYIAFEPTQIKSVENLGYYNAQDPRMLYQTNVYDGLTTTNSVMSATNILQQLKDGSHERLLFDARNGNWYLANADEIVHADMFIKAFHQGNYPEFNNKREAEQYFQENYLSDDPTLFQFMATKYDNPADTRQAMEHTLGTDEYTNAYLRDDLVVFARSETELAESGFPVEGFDHYKVEYDENGNRKVVLVDKATEDINEVLYQIAYAGAPVDYNKPSLKFIGSGEGAASHGWGLYYALDPMIAEMYRQKFVFDYRHVTLYKGEEVDVLKEDTPHDQALSDLVRDYSSIKDTDMSVRKQKFIKKYEDEIASTKQYVKENKDRLKQETIRDSSRTMFDFYQEKIKHDEAMLDAFKNIDATQIKEKQWGQVHEVDIPEMDVLLDEQKMLIDQPKYVEDIIWKINKDLDLGIVDSGITGDRIYQKISDKLGSDKAASQYLDKEGIKGITYYGRDDGRCFVIFNDKSVKVLRKKFDELGNQLFSLDFQSPKLVATHAIRKEGMEQALNVGGFAMPSLAITKDIDANTYGEIVFVAPASMAQPSRTTRVYDRDAWTPMINFIEYTAKEGFADRVKDILPPGADWSMFVSNIEDKANSWPEDNIMAKQLFAIYKDFPEEEVPFIQRKFDENNDLRKEYLQWYQDFVMSNMQGRIFRGFTPTGTRRYAPVTLDNIVRELKTQPEHRDFSYMDFYNYNDVVRELVTRFKSTEDIKKEQDRLQDTNAVYEADQDLFYEYMDIAHDLKKEGPYPEYALAAAILDTEGALAERLEKYDLKNDAQSVRDVERLIEKIKKTPVRYFEVKPQRAVRFNEFSAVFVPKKESYDEIAERLTEQGANVLRYGSKEERVAMFDELVNGDDTILFQGRRAKVRAVYDPELLTVILGKDWNELSLVHEFHHHYLKKIWDYFKQAQAGMRTVSKAWLDDTQRLFSMLEIDPNQKGLTTVQQEKFAYMVEAYLTGLGVENQDNLAFQGFLHWIPEKYRSIMDLGYLDANGQIQNPMLDEESIAFFNKWFASPLVPSLPSAPDAQRIMNASDEDGEIIPSNQKVMNNREKEWGQDSEIQNKADAQLWRGIGENTPSDMRAALDGEKELMKVETNNMPDDRKLPVATKPTLREKWFKTRQPDAREMAAEAARAYLAKNPEHARELAFADPETLAEFDAPVDQGMLIRAVMETVNKGSDEWYVLDNNLAMVKSMSGSTLSLSGDLSHQAYLDAKREIEMARELKAITNYAGTGRGAAEKWNGDIRAFAARRTAAILATEPNSEERKVAIEAFLEEAKTKFSGNTTNAVLNQLDLTGYQTKSSQVFIKWAEKQIKNVSHARLDAKEQAELMKASVAAQLALQDIDSKELKDGKYVRAVQSSKDIRHWQFVKDKMKKAYIGRWGKFGILWDNLWGSYAPSAMLMSVNTLFFANVPSTTINTGTIRLAALSIGENNVDKNVRKGEIKRIKQIFNASGMNIAQMDKPTSPSLLHGEKYTQQEQKHWYNFTFDILGREDNVFRVPTFVDALARIATKNANGDAKKATALFNEYTKLNTTDDEAKIARKQALAVANMAVFTQDGIMASALNHIRSSLNTMTRGALGLEPGGFGLGNILAPFLKTGANITEMGLSAALALPRTAIAIAQNKLLGKEIPDIRRISLISDWINLAWTAVVIAVLAAISGDDDDWYTEPYESGKRYDPYKPYDSVRFGNTWVKLDIFGPMAIPLRTALKVVKDWEKKKLAAVADGLAFGGMEALSDTPLVNQFMDNQVDYMTKQPGAYWSSFGYNQLNKLVPAQAKTLTKAGSRATGVEWDTPWMGKAIDRKFHRNYGLDGERLTTNDLINIFTNRLKYKPQE